MSMHVLDKVVFKRVKSTNGKYCRIETYGVGYISGKPLLIVFLRLVRGHRVGTPKSHLYTSVSVKNKQTNKQKTATVR